MSLFWRLAVRDLRGGLGGLRLLAVCLFLGVAALSGVGSLSAAIISSLAAEGRTILGGDVSVEIAQRRATPEERAVFESYGETIELIQTRANVSRGDNSESLIGELKAVGDDFPLYGTFTLEGGGALQAALADGVLLGRGAGKRLGVEKGDIVRVGRGRFPLAGILDEEPDKVAEGFVIGPTIMMSLADFARTGLEQPGSLFQSHYRIRVPESVDLEMVEEALLERFPAAGFDVDTRDNAAPGVRRFVQNTGQFLTLVGLTSLLVAGVGVGSGVTSYLATKTRSIAALKSVGASARAIFSIYLIQIGLVTFVAVIAGALTGALVPGIVSAAAGQSLPAPPAAGLYPLPLATAAAFGFLTAFLFALWPLTQAREVPAAQLFRATAEGTRRPPARIMAVQAALALAIFLIAVLQARQPLLAAGFLAASVLVLIALAVLAAAIMWAVRRLPSPRQPLIRLALGNLTRPGGMTRQLTVALGLGLTLFAVLAVIETNLSSQIENTIPKEAPSHFILDIPAGGKERLRALSDRFGDSERLRVVPSLRGPITAVKGVQVADMESLPENAWALRGDRGLTFTGALPPGNRITAGDWWPEDYSGPQLISIDVELAEALDLAVGDTLTVSVLGIPLQARIASFREIDWGTMGFNFALVFSPGPIETAPYSYMATAGITDANDRAFTRAMGEAFPSASVIRISDVIDSASDLLAQLTTAIRAASSVAVLAGIAVLIGAIAAARRARTYDAVMLKVLGATRGQIVLGFLIEFAVLSLTVASLSLVLGAVGGWYTITQVFELEWLPRWGPVFAVVGAGAVTIVLFSLIGAWSALRTRPATALRTL